MLSRTGKDLPLKLMINPGNLIRKGHQGDEGMGVSAYLIEAKCFFLERADIP